MTNAEFNSTVLAPVFFPSALSPSKMVEESVNKYESTFADKRSCSKSSDFHNNCKCYKCVDIDMHHLALSPEVYRKRNKEIAQLLYRKTEEFDKTYFNSGVKLSSLWGCFVDLSAKIVLDYFL